MTRYDWPAEFTKSPDRLESRSEARARSGGLPTPPGLLGDLDDLDDVITANFDEDRLWLPLGPTILMNGQARGNPIVSGRVRSLHVSPDGSRIYAAAANGGMWYSGDSGATWNPLGSWGLAAGASRSDMSLTIGAALVKFGATQADDIVYVATGEPRPWVSATPGTALGGIGVLRLNGPADAALAAPGTNPWKREGRNLVGNGIFRIVRNPATALTADGAGELVVASSNGLWTRSGPFDEDGDWTRVDFTPSKFDANDRGYCSDVVWNARGLWVALAGRGAEDGLYHSANGTAGPFTRITLPNYHPRTRITLAEAPHNTKHLYVLSLIPPPVDPANDCGLAQLWQVDLDHSSSAAVAIANTPVSLFSDKVSGVAPNFVIESDQAHYDQAMLVSADSGNDIVYIGGAAFNIGAGGWNASLFRLTITGTAAAGDLTCDFDPARQTRPHSDAATYIGAGIHPDVHALALAGSNLWVGCDGGVFRRSSGIGGPAQSMNAGLAITEPGYIASHPDLDGPMLAGTQDNGAIQRVGNTVWRLLRKGDGGGCAYHPTRPYQSVMQYTNASWRFHPMGFSPPGPVLRSAPKAGREATEDGRASFYSAPAVAQTSSPDTARIFVGSDRIWYSNNWDKPANAMTWQTIPTNRDPWSATDAINNIAQDRLSTAFDEEVLVIRMLQNGNPAANFDGTAILVLTNTNIRIFRYSDSGGGSWTSIPNSLVSDRSGVERPKHKKRNDDVPNPFLDWLPRKRNSTWTDIAVHRNNTAGSESFYVTTTGSARVQNDGSLVGDPHFDTLWWYDGAGRWYPTGLRNAPLDATAGTGGCPLSAHSVVVDPVAPDIVYVGTRIGVWEGRLDSSGTHPVWSWKPAMEGLPQTLVEDLHIKQTADGMFLRAAVVSRGVWERDISVVPVSVGRSFIRSISYDSGRTLLPAAPRDPDSNLLRNYHESPDIKLFPPGTGSWGAGTPSEAELLDTPMAGTLARGVYDAYVMVHHRHTTPVAANDVNIDLFLLHAAPGGEISGINMAPLRATILGKVRGDGSADAGSTPHYLGRFHPAHAVDARNSRAARLSVDLTFAIDGGGASDHVALIAVVTSPGNLLADAELDRPNLHEVVRRTGKVAVRKIRRI